jgi:hypothetical protein
VGLLTVEGVKGCCVDGNTFVCIEGVLGMFLNTGMDTVPSSSSIEELNCSVSSLNRRVLLGIILVNEGS